MARTQQILLLICLLPGAVLPSFIAARLITPAPVRDGATRTQSVNADSASTAEADRPDLTQSGRSDSDPGDTEEREQGRSTTNGFSALRPSPSDMPKENHSRCESNRFGESVKAVPGEWSDGHTLMAVRLDRVVAVSKSNATELASVAPSVLPLGPPIGN